MVDEDNVVFLVRRRFNSDNLLIVSGTKTWISNLNLIRESFQGYRCKASIAIIAWMVTFTAPINVKIYSLPKNKNNFNLF